MYRSISYKSVLQKNFQEELHWYEEEFDIMFKNKQERYTKQEIDIGNQILNRLTEIINIYHHEDFLHQLVEILNNLERKYPSFF
ncbi:MAG: hypothetical protein ACTSPS_06815 [Promethearchaeota archaeon]